MYWPHGLVLFVQDPDYLQDLFQTYNSVFTKEDHAKKAFSNLFWNSLIWTKSADPTYKPRRHLISHAFYASKLKAMSDTVFKVIEKRLMEWPTIFNEGKLDMVKELIHIQG